MIKTPQQLISDIINEHPIHVAFVIEAVRFYSENVIKQGEPEDNPKALISPKLWYAVAETINSQLVYNFESKKATENGNSQTSGNLS
jgi:ABC-type Zn uptake system ZnuABC Zn-binding protein ZnuA